MGWYPDILGTLATTFRVARATLDASSLTANRTLTLPDASGTLALTAGNASLAATEGHIRTLVASTAVQAGDQCTVSAEGVRGAGRFPLLGSAVTPEDDRFGNVYVRLASGRILAASAKLRLAVGSGAAVLDEAGTALLSLSSSAVELYRIADDIWFLAGAGLIYDDTAQQSYAAPTTLHDGATVIGNTIVHGVTGGFGLFDLTSHSSVSVTAFPQGADFVFQGWAASGSIVCAVGTILVAGVYTAYLVEYDLTGTVLRAITIGTSAAALSVTVQPASIAGHFFVATAGDGVNGTLYPYAAGGTLGGYVHGFGTAGDSLALWGFDGSVYGYALTFERFNDSNHYTAYWTGSEIAVSSLYDWGSFPPCLLLRSPAGQVFALADDGVPGSTLVLVGISASVSGTLSQPKQPFAVSPEGLFATIAPRQRVRGLCQPPSFDNGTVTVKGVWGVNGLLKGLAANAYTISEAGTDLVLATSLTLADVGATALDTAMLNGYGWRCAADGSLLDLSRSINGTWHLLDGATLSVTASAPIAASTTAVQMMDRIGPAAYLVATRTGLRLSLSSSLTDGYTVATTTDPTMVPAPDAFAVALADAVQGQPVDVLLWGSADLALSDGAYACGNRRCFGLGGKVTLL